MDLINVRIRNWDIINCEFTSDWKPRQLLADYTRIYRRDTGRTILKKDNTYLVNTYSSREPKVEVKLIDFKYVDMRDVSEEILESVAQPSLKMFWWQWMWTHSLYNLRNTFPTDPDPVTLRTLLHIRGEQRDFMAYQIFLKRIR